MKYFSIIVLFFVFNHINAQILGDTKFAILELENSDPCEIKADKLLFCYNERDMISYSFD